MLKNLGLEVNHFSHNKANIFDEAGCRPQT